MFFVKNAVQVWTKREKCVKIYAIMRWFAEKSFPEVFHEIFC